MNEVIGTILEAEAKADEIVREGEREARRILSEGEAAAERAVSEAETRLAAHKRERLAAADTQAEARYQAILAEGEARAQRFTNACGDSVEAWARQLAEKVFER